MAALRASCKETEERWSIIVHFKQRGRIPREVDPAVALCLYRVVQEAMQNVVRHSDSQEMQVQLTAEEDHIRLTVRDNGKGFDVRVQSGTGLGLASMRERVKQVFGSFEVQSKPGHGTEINVIVPLLPKSA